MSWQLAAALGVVMCLGFAAGPEQKRGRQPVSATVGQPFALAAGASAKLKGEPLEIGFTRVVMDSRCPKGAECITAGVAVVAMWVSLDGGRTTPELRTDPPAAARVERGPYTVTLVKLEPHPQVGRRIAPGYVATLVVRRR
jgi:hypothetical protein